MGIDALVKRFSPVLICLMLAIAAYFQARGVSQLVGAALLSASPLPPARRPDTHPAPRASDRDLRADAILERNPFDSMTGPLTAREAHPPSLDPAASSADPFADPPCDIARVTVIVTADDPAWAFATIIGPDGKTVLRRAGEEFYGGRVDHISGLRVWLVGPSGMRCQLVLGAKPPKLPAGPPPPPPPGQSAGLPGGIRQIGEHEFDVQRSVLDGLVANPADLMKVRVVPEKDGDRIIGLRLFGIKPNSLLGTLGIQNNDRLVSINGFEMNDPQRMLEAYSRLLRADHLSATVVRNGRPMQIDFNIK